MSINVKHNAGFFSCCSIRLLSIIQFINRHKKLPNKVISKEQFKLYKKNKKEDVTFHFFTDYNTIDVSINKLNQKIIYIDQFKDYKLINFELFNSLIVKYFTPSKKILEIENVLINKYNINVNNTISVYYRGTDKKKETIIGSINNYSLKVDEILNLNKNLKILLITDTGQCYDYFNSKYKDNLIFIKENKLSYNKKGIHKQNNCITNYNDMFNLFPTFLIASKSKYLICSSSNCSYFMILYRNNCENIFQFLNNKWL